jgi:type II secretory ATPase GspE/PulE/Tfp pilus assembly ATPase PilB-like protein
MVNGVKHEVMQPPNYIKSEIINHTKVIANLDILKQNCHQDGKISFKYEGIRHESVITVVPSVNGNDENIIIKILN